MRVFLSAVACFALLGFCASTATATVMNPEDFESYTLVDGVYHLTAGDGWSSDAAGTVDPNADDHQVIAGQMLKLEHPASQDYNNGLIWQQKVFANARQILRYDVMLQDGADVDWDVERSMNYIPVASGNAPFISFVSTSPNIGISLHNGENYAQQWAAASLDTWYRVEVELDSGAAQTAKMRYKAVGGDWSDWSANTTMSADPDGLPVAFSANDRVFYDNISLTAVPEPGTIVLCLSAFVGLLAYAWRKGRRTNR